MRKEMVKVVLFINTYTSVLSVRTLKRQSDTCHTDC